MKPAALLASGLLLLGLLAPGEAGAEQPVRIAIIIDDMGYQASLDRAILDLPEALAVAIIPDAPNATQLARAAEAQARETLIHLPLAGKRHDHCKLALECIGPDWPLGEIVAYLETALETVPGAMGFNNHQGSRFTSDERAVEKLIQGITWLNLERDAPLSVIDSRTTATTHLESAAREAGIPNARRRVFLDHDDDPEKIREAWQDLLDLARYHGHAVAIGHPRHNTLEVLREKLPGLAEEAVSLVPVSELLEQPGR